LKKDSTISLRVRSNELKKIKDLGFNYADVWQLGYERILENELSELKKLEQKYHNLYIHVHTKIENFGKKLESEQAELDRLFDWYIKNHSIENPAQRSIEALRFQMKKRDIYSHTVEQVLDYFKEKNGGR
jgi:hypothetical protein